MDHVSRSSGCPCPKCWGTDPTAEHVRAERDLRMVYTVKFMGEGGYYLSAVEEGYGTAEEALAAAETLGVTVEGIR